MSGDGLAALKYRGLGRPAGAVTTRVYCAGLSDAQNVLLTRDLGPSGLWQILA